MAGDDKASPVYTENEAKTSSVAGTITCLQPRQEYLELLVPPSAEEFDLIASTQQRREDGIKKKSHEHGRSLDAAVPINSTSQPSAVHHPPADRGSVSDRPAIIQDILMTRAATLIQRTYRGYRARRQMAGLSLDANTRWTHALREARFRELTKPRPRSCSADTGVGGRTHVSHQNKNPSERSSEARRKWRKAAVVARRAGWDEDSASDTSSDALSVSSHDGLDGEQKRVPKEARQQSRAKRRKEAKTMGLRYFLEMVDHKHRYGSNLRTYHEEWMKSETHENFFYWLDYGHGRNLNLEACPRDRLEREQVRYLSREERQYYLVRVDEDGRLCWAKNGLRIDTTEEWRDSMYGIVPRDDPAPTYRPKASSRSCTSGANAPSHDTDPSDGNRSPTEPSDSELEAARAAKYANPTLDEAEGVKKVAHVSTATLFNKMLRKSVRKNTWIFVADTSFRLYIGIKEPGAFQHSSFLQGGRISAAGLIKVKKGRLTSLSPLSGHYRPPAANFRAFVKSLRDMGVDMSHVSISKSYAVLVGLDVYMRSRQKSKSVIQKLAYGKDKIVAPDEIAKKQEEEKDKSESAAREREVLAQEARERHANNPGVKALRKLAGKDKEHAADTSRPVGS